MKVFNATIYHSLSIYDSDTSQCDIIRICNNNPFGAITVDDEQHKSNVHLSLGILGGLIYELKGKEGKNSFNR